MDSLLDFIKKTDARTRIVAATAVLVLLVIGGTAGMISSRPHFEVLFSDLDDSQRVAVEKALAGGKVKYRISQPPAPFVIYVDEGSQYEAQNLVALSEALEPKSAGIETGDGGAGTLFLSSGERQQGMLKREWQEMEHQLMELDFVSKATVTTSTPDSSPLRRDKPVTVSVMLRLRNRDALSAEHADTVAKLVRFRFNVPPENVVISDQSGRALYDPTESRGTDSIKSLMEHAEEYDKNQQAKANEALVHAFGVNKAYVTVNSQWNHEQSTSRSETVEPTKKVISEETITSETPQGAPSVGGPAGVSSNLSEDFGVGNAGVPTDTPSARPGADLAKTKESKRTYDASRSTTQTVRSAPRLERLSVSLMLDESLAEKRDEIEGIVKAAVGFDASRNDTFNLGTTTFAVGSDVQPADGESADSEPAGEGSDSGPSPMLELLLQRAIELAAALAFIVLLFKTLKGAGKTGPATLRADAGDEADTPDPELLARHQIEELVRTDPRRVGEVLSRWADEGSPTGP